VRDKNGCGTVTRSLFIDVPQILYPNGDNLTTLGKSNFQIMRIGLSIQLFDRYGKFIKELTQNNSWMACSMVMAETLDYWFVVTRSNGKEKSRSF
jgi:gliding motility-associated-like protein